MFKNSIGVWMISSPPSHGSNLLAGIQGSPFRFKGGGSEEVGWKRQTK